MLKNTLVFFFLKNLPLLEHSIFILIVRARIHSDSWIEIVRRVTFLLSFFIFIFDSYLKRVHRSEFFMIRAYKFTLPTIYIRRRGRKICLSLFFFS